MTMTMMMVIMEKTGDASSLSVDLHSPRLASLSRSADAAAAVVVAVTEVERIDTFAVSLDVRRGVPSPALISISSAPNNSSASFSSPLLFRRVVAGKSGLGSEFVVLSARSSGDEHEDGCDPNVDESDEDDDDNVAFSVISFIRDNEVGGGSAAAAAAAASALLRSEKESSSVTSAQ